ncbi:sigma-54 interaction domain-containing protein [Pseudemcibacter sp.]|uniref:sigma-54 interaction domain-containing protein n=1 Tax=Pseudemcibacter sp. TaxID=2943293 RepID=UPI003F698BA4
MVRAKTLARKGAKTNVPILLSGDSGVGKEIFARATHMESDRSEKPFVVVNCGALPENLVESILFGHVKGAFTDAIEDHAGKFTEANEGTIFLEEIGELPLDIQVKLLRVLQENEVDPVGGEKVHKIDVRIISATNKNLQELVANGQFREDLFYRVNVFPVEIPLLNKRQGDIQTLVSHFVQKVCDREGRMIKSLTTNATMLLNSYHWPGNVRQLENAVMRAVILSDGDMITDKDFPQILEDIKRLAKENKRKNRRADDLIRELDIPKEFHYVTIYDEKANVRRLDHIENIMIRYAFVRYKGKMTEIARRQGMGRSTLYRKAAEIGLLDE